jgi:biotin synthase
MSTLKNLLDKSSLSREDIILLLQAEGEAMQDLFRKATEVKRFYVQDKVYFRGLIEFSNICSKNCYYCGIRSANRKTERYNLSDDEIVDAAIFAYENGYGSIVLQSGELSNKRFVNRISNLLSKIHGATNQKLRITLSCGEQERDTYQKWFDLGAIRYLLRIETSNRDLFYKLHPNNRLHDFDNRLKCLEYLKDVGYQVGTGVMIGLPYQTYDDLAGDLLWMKSIDVDMVGMGPYIEHHDTQLYDLRHLLLPIGKRFELSLKMIALLRILMKDINIAAATALQAIDKTGREKAVEIGANVIMPNITPYSYRDQYKLYENKPMTTDSPDDFLARLEERIKLAKNEIAYNEWGDSKHWEEKQ